MKVMREVGGRILYLVLLQLYMVIRRQCRLQRTRPKGQCTNPYGWTKSMMEQIMTDVQAADPEWNVVLLRYFNPVGAHESGTDRGRSERNPEQSDAIHFSGGSWKT